MLVYSFVMRLSFGTYIAIDLALTGRCWRLTTSALLDAGYCVIGFDRRNHGASESPTHGQRLSARQGPPRAADGTRRRRRVPGRGSMGASAIWAYFDLFGYARCLGTVSVDPEAFNATLLRFLAG